MDVLTAVQTLFELIFHNILIWAVDHQPLFCTFSAHAQNLSKQSSHLGPKCPNGKLQDLITIKWGGRGKPLTRTAIHLDTLDWSMVK